MKETLIALSVWERKYTRFSRGEKCLDEEWGRRKNLQVRTEPASVIKWWRLLEDEWKQRTEPASVMNNAETLWEGDELETRSNWCEQLARLSVTRAEGKNDLINIQKQVCQGEPDMISRGEREKTSSVRNRSSLRQTSSVRNRTSLRQTSSVINRTSLRQNWDRQLTHAIESVTGLLVQCSVYYTGLTHSCDEAWMGTADQQWYSI